MECNAGELSQSTCTADPAAAEFLFDNETITTLKKYQFIMVTQKAQIIEKKIIACDRM
jgi:invasion protein IalB